MSRTQIRILRPALLAALFLLPACQSSSAGAPRPLSLKTIHAPTGHCAHVPSPPPASAPR